MYFHHPYLIFLINNFEGVLTLRTSTSNKSEEFGGTLEGTPCYKHTQHFQFSEEQMNQLLIAICKGGKSEANMATTTKRFSTNK